MTRGSKPGERRGGRQKGTPNRTNAEREAAIRASGMTPLDYLMTVIRNEAEQPAMRLKAAEIAAQYVHPKLSAVEASVTVSNHEQALAELE